MENQYHISNGLHFIIQGFLICDKQRQSTLFYANNNDNIIIICMHVIQNFMLIMDFIIVYMHVNIYQMKTCLWLRYVKWICKHLDLVMTEIESSSPTFFHYFAEFAFVLHVSLVGSSSLYIKLFIFPFVNKLILKQLEMCSAKVYLLKLRRHDAF